jgi:putative ABC transport system substrate-binding protein
MDSSAMASNRSLGRRRFVQALSGLGLAAAGLPLLAGCRLRSPQATPPATVRRLGVLSAEPGFARDRDPGWLAFQQGLRELGWIEGTNFTTEYRAAEDREERLPDLAAELVHLRVDLILAIAVAAVRAAQHATATIPIVMFINSDPVAGGLVTSYARPGGNVTGVAASTPELAAKRLELLKQAVPAIARVAVLWDPSVPAKVLESRAVQAEAQTLGLGYQSLEVRGPEEFAGAFAATRGRADGLAILGSPLTVTYRARILDFAAQTGLPAMYDKREFAADGGLLAYVPNTRDVGQRQATYVAKILKGAKPADLPVEQPTRFDLVINLKTAQALGITIPPSVLAQATEVIQ